MSLTKKKIKISQFIEITSSVMSDYVVKMVIKSIITVPFRKVCLSLNISDD